MRAYNAYPATSCGVPVPAGGCVFPATWNEPGACIGAAGAAAGAAAPFIAPNLNLLSIKILKQISNDPEIN